MCFARRPAETEKMPGWQQRSFTDSTCTTVRHRCWIFNFFSKISQMVPILFILEDSASKTFSNFTLSEYEECFCLLFLPVFVLSLHGWVLTSTVCVCAAQWQLFSEVLLGLCSDFHYIITSAIIQRCVMHCHPRDWRSRPFNHGFQCCPSCTELLCLCLCSPDTLNLWMISDTADDKIFNSDKILSFWTIRPRNEQMYFLNFSVPKFDTSHCSSTKHKLDAFRKSCLSIPTFLERGF